MRFIVEDRYEGRNRKGNGSIVTNRTLTDKMKTEKKKLGKERKVIERGEIEVS